MFIPATAQMTFKHFNTKTNEGSWKSVSVGGFKPNGRGCKSDSFVCPLILSLKRVELTGRKSNTLDHPLPRRNTSSPPTSTVQSKSLLHSLNPHLPLGSNTVMVLRGVFRLLGLGSKRRKGMDLSFIDSCLF
jgi:hypothetical protein